MMVAAATPPVGWAVGIGIAAFSLGCALATEVSKNVSGEVAKDDLAAAAETTKLVNALLEQGAAIRKANAALRDQADVLLGILRNCTDIEEVAKSPAVIASFK